MSTIGKLYRRGAKGTWQIQFTDASGKLHRESTHTAKEPEAKALLKTRIGEVEAGTYAAGKQRVMFADLRKLIESDYEINGKRLKKIKGKLDHLQASFGNLRAVDITATRIADYIKMRKAGTTIRLERVGEEVVRVEKPVANASINRELSALGRMFTLANAAGMLNFRPRVPRLIEDNAREGFVAPADFETINALLPNYLKDPIRFSVLTGWRKGRVVGLLRAHVDTRNGFIQVPQKQSSNKRVGIVPLVGEIAELIARQTVDLSCPFVFHRNGKPLGDFKKAWNTARKAAGFPNLHVHDLRRSFARNAVRAGVPDVVVMRMGGWKTRSMLDRYNVVSGDDMQMYSQRMQEYFAEQRQDKKVVKITGGTK